jgi:uncharacterized membrane protein YqjE
MKKEVSLFILLGIIVLASRLPFLADGYGSEDDSWGLVLNARLMAQTGEYSFSRLPGHPVQEYLLMLMPNAGAFNMNMLSVLFSVISALCFAGILKHYNMNNRFLWSVVFATIPAIWISSTYTIDYTWALAFILLAWYGTLKKYYAWAGVFLGLAIGCRITSGAVIAGLIWMAVRQEKSNLRPLLSLCFFTLIMASLCFLPSWLKYGWSFFDTYRLPYPSLPKVLYKASFGVWGGTGCLALLLLLITKVKGLSAEAQQFKKSFPLVLVCLLYLLAFLVLPQKSAFFIPAIPFLLVWLLDQSFKPAATAILSLLFILSPLMFGFNLASAERGADYSDFALVRKIAGQEVFLDPLNGPLQNEQSRRRNRQAYISQALKAASQLTPNDLVLCGWWTNQFTVNCQDMGGCRFQIGEFFDKPQLDSIIRSGSRIWYLSEIDQANDERYGMTYTASVARELR